MALAVDLFCGLGGWTIGLQAAGWDVIGFDIERRPYPSQLVLQDVATIDAKHWRGKVQLLIVASPPCQAYSYRAMPWKRAKALPPPDNSLFEHCFRISDEAQCPIVIENVCGAQRWVGRAKWHYGSFYLWGDVPAIMPYGTHRKIPAAISDSIRAGKSPARWTNPDEHYFGQRCAIRDPQDRVRLSRKEASARIAVIPFDLARWIGECFLPAEAARRSA